MMMIVEPKSNYLTRSIVKLDGNEVHNTLENLSRPNVSPFLFSRDKVSQSQVS